jgi:phosphomannomutase
MNLTCFKAYDIRGKLGDELNEIIAYAIGRAFALELSPKEVVLGGDIRLTSESLKLALASGLQDEGVNVTYLGMTGTEEIYFATKHLNICGGVEVTASHNPMDYNGMKLVQEDVKPISGDTGLFAIKLTAGKVLSGLLPLALEQQRGSYIIRNLKTEFAQCIVSLIDVAKLKLLKLVADPGDGAAGHSLDAIETLSANAGCNIEFIKVHHKPDGKFPNGIPNPLLPEYRADTANAVKAHNADIGIAWDGNFNRCFLFDENGEFIEVYYIVGLLDEVFLQSHPNEITIHDPRLTLNTVDIVEAIHGTAIMSKTGHAFIKERIRLENAIYGGEISAHHCFRDFAYPSSGEINSKLADPKASIVKVEQAFRPIASSVDKTDGIAKEFKYDEGEWRFNLRSSNTEPAIRLNVESIGNIKLMNKRTNQLLSILRN